MSGDVRVIHGDCLDVLPTLADASVDAVVTDPPYPEIDRPYGRMTEADWHVMMRGVVAECRRILKPSGSAVFILQPNYERIGKTRLWLWEFMAWVGRAWNIVEDAYWWNYNAYPSAGCEERNGLMRRAVKTCVWIGSPDCCRNQVDVLWTNALKTSISRARGGVSIRERDMASASVSGRLVYPSGQGKNPTTMYFTPDKRGGATPQNLLPMVRGNGESKKNPAAYGHGGGTPESVMDWWVRYISPPGGVVCDPFMGVGTTGLAARQSGRSFIGIDKEADYVAIARRRLDGPPMPLFDDMPDVAPDPTPLFASLAEEP